MMQSQRQANCDSCRLFLNKVKTQRLPQLGMKLNGSKMNKKLQLIGVFEVMWVITILLIYMSAVAWASVSYEICSLSAVSLSAVLCILEGKVRENT